MEQLDQVVTENRPALRQTLSNVRDLSGSDNVSFFGPTGLFHALATLQSQLAQGQQEVAAQREELLQRLGSAPAIPIATRPEKPSREPGISEPSESTATPKPAASRAAEQFRKLRRDAKRKAIGA